LSLNYLVDEFAGGQQREVGVLSENVWQWSSEEHVRKSAALGREDAAAAAEEVEEASMA